MSELTVHASTCETVPMVQIDDLRASFSARLKKALNDSGIPDWGAGVRLAEIAGVTPKATSKWLCAESMPSRGNMAKIADALGVRVEWLEYGEGPRHAGDSHEGGKVITADFSRKAKPGELSIPQFDVRAAMGSGQLPNDYVEIIRHVTMHKSHLDLLGITYTSAANLAIITGWGQSMAGTINHGEPVFVDRGVTSFIGDGVYVFTWDDLVYIKRVQKISKTHFKVISDNRDHDPFEVPIEEVVFHAQALLAWNARKL